MVEKSCYGCILRVCRIADSDYGILYNTYMFPFWLRLTRLFPYHFFFSQKYFLAFFYTVDGTCGIALFYICLKYLFNSSFIILTFY